jgi:hypothetical protein
MHHVFSCQSANANEHQDMDLCNKNKTTDPSIQTISWWTQPCTEIAAPTLGRSLVEMKLSIIYQWEETWWAQPQRLLPQ